MCYHCLLLSFHMACEGTCVHQCLILTLDLVLTSVSLIMQMNTYQLTRKMWQFPITKTESVKTEVAKQKRGTWYVSGINTARR